MLLALPELPLVSFFLYFSSFSFIVLENGKTLPLLSRLSDRSIKVVFSTDGNKRILIKRQTISKYVQSLFFFFFLPFFCMSVKSCAIVKTSRIDFDLVQKRNRLQLADKIKKIREARKTRATRSTVYLHPVRILPN